MSNVIQAHVDALMAATPDLAERLKSGEVAIGIVTGDTERCKKCGHMNSTCKGKKAQSKKEKRAAASQVVDADTPPNQGKKKLPCDNFACVRGQARRLCERGICGCACHT